MNASKIITHWEAGSHNDNQNETTEFLTDAYWLREFSKAAMQGYLANYGGNSLSDENVARDSIKSAQALLKAIKESEENKP